MEPFAGMVVRADGPQVTVRDGQGRTWRCVLRGRLRQDVRGTTSPVVVGDRVEVEGAASGNGALGAVRRVLPRRSQLSRRAPDDKSAPEQVLVANLDLAVIVVSCPLRPTVIDRYLALAHKGGCPPLVCANKIDLAAREVAEPLAETYRLAMIPVLLTSALSGEGVEALREAVSGKLVAFVGPSGAGKSSLLNALDPSLHLRVGPPSASGKGSHTTSWAAVFEVGSALIADTPGLRQIGFVGDEGAGAADDLFPEISALAGGCRFRNCSHTHEPRCAVKAALAAGDLDAGLYQRYARLARSGRL